VTVLRVGTRRSPLALAQAEEVCDLLGAAGVASEIVPMATSGDEGARVGALGMKGLWIDSIIDALDKGEIDVAVHSAKDLPAEEEDGFVIAAVPDRADATDMMISRENALPRRAQIGTSSLRRRAQLMAADPSLRMVEMRGNVQTRLKKLEEGRVDAIVLAAAGLQRLGISPAHANALPIDVMVPAPGQGCLAVQARGDDDETIEAVGAIDHRPSHAALNAERSLVWRLGGGCYLPLGAHATADPDGHVAMVAVVASLDGALVVRAAVDAESPEAAAARVAKDLIAGGAEAILAEVVGEEDEDR
jgi:hydroxymethylbilane synthase